MLSFGAGGFSCCLKALHVVQRKNIIAIISFSLNLCSTLNFLIFAYKKPGSGSGFTKKPASRSKTLKVTVPVFFRQKKIAKIMTDE
jgi:hypothetical protein